jgi:hypothetical protein
MSFQAMAWAVEQKCENAGEKLVLLMLANHCNGHTGQCNPSQSRLADECSMGVSTLKRHIAGLADKGFIEVTQRAVDGVSLPNHYSLNLTPPRPNRTGGGSELDGGSVQSGREVGPNRAGGGSESGYKPGIEPGIEPINILGEEFEKAWTAFPKRPGSSKVEALKAWTAQVEAGAKPADLAAGAQRYASFCVAAKTDPKFFLKPAKFFGPDQHYLADWSTDQSSAATAAIDPDSQSAIEAEGIAKGIGKWDGMCQWGAYKARVRGAPLLNLNLNTLATMAANRTGVH